MAPQPICRISKESTSFVQTQMPNTRSTYAASRRIRHADRTASCHCTSATDIRFDSPMIVFVEPKQELYICSECYSAALGSLVRSPQH